MLNGNRICLRPLKKSDNSLFFKWRNNIEYIGMAQSIRFPKHEFLEENWTEHKSKDTSNKEIFFIIEISETNEAIGFTQLSNIDWISRNCSFGISINESQHQKKGFANEAMEVLYGYAFNILNIEKIWLEVTSLNIPAIKLYEKFGFTLEGQLKKHYYWDSQYHDVLIYSLFKNQTNHK